MNKLASKSPYRSVCLLCMNALLICSVPARWTTCDRIQTQTTSVRELCRAVLFTVSIFIHVSRLLFILFCAGRFFPRSLPSFSNIHRLLSYKPSTLYLSLSVTELVIILSVVRTELLAINISTKHHDDRRRQEHSSFVSNLLRIVLFLVFIVFSFYSTLYVLSSLVLIRASNEHHITVSFSHTRSWCWISNWICVYVYTVYLLLLFYFVFVIYCSIECWRFVSCSTVLCVQIESVLLQTDSVSISNVLMSIIQSPFHGYFHAAPHNRSFIQHNKHTHTHITI